MIFIYTDKHPIYHCTEFWLYYQGALQFYGISEKIIYVLKGICFLITNGCKINKT